MFAQGLLANRFSVLAGSSSGDRRKSLADVSLIMYYIQLILLGGTPRNAWAKRNNLNTPAFGEIFPATSLIVVISEHQTLARRSPYSAPRLTGPLRTAISYSII